MLLNIKKSIKEQKQELRKDIRERKKMANRIKMIEESTEIFRQIEGLDEFKAAKTVLAYWSLSDEVFTHDFIKKWHRHKQVLLPLVVGDKLELKVFTGIECMEVGPSFGILEPIYGLTYDNQGINIAIIPGMAFDLSGNRLGRGKGYYDKLLSSNSPLKIGIAHSYQLVPIVPVDSFDIPMDMIIHS